MASLKFKKLKMTILRTSSTEQKLLSHLLKIVQQERGGGVYVLHTAVHFLYPMTRNKEQHLLLRGIVTH